MAYPPSPSVVRVNQGSGFRVQLNVKNYAHGSLGKTRNKMALSQRLTGIRQPPDCAGFSPLQTERFQNEDGLDFTHTTKAIAAARL